MSSIKDPQGEYASLSHSSAFYSPVLLLISWLASTSKSLSLASIIQLCLFLTTLSTLFRFIFPREVTIITLPQKVKVIWRRKWTTWLYACIRYTTLAFVICSFIPLNTVRPFHIIAARIQRLTLWPNCRSKLASIDGLMSNAYSLSYECFVAVQLISTSLKRCSQCSSLASPVRTTPAVLSSQEHYISCLCLFYTIRSVLDSELKSTSNTLNPSSAFQRYTRHRAA